METVPVEQVPAKTSAALSMTPAAFARQPSRSDRSLHALILAAAVAVPVLGWLMTPLPGGQVAVAGLEATPLPTVCLSRRLGWDCPTCGVTRSIIALVHGEISQSLARHRFGWLVLFNILVQIPYRGYRLVRPDRPLPRLEWAGIWLLLGTAVIVVGNRFLEAFGLL